MQGFFEHGFEDSRAESAYIHESSYVDSPCRIGEHTAILHFSHVMANSIIGDHCHIGHNVTISSGVLIGNHVRVMNNALLNGGVILEDEVYCGPSSVFVPLKNARGGKGSISKVSPTLVRRGAHIGANTTIANGFTIGLHTFVEAGTVIDRNIPDYALVSGNPLRFTGWRCECGERLKFKEDTTVACATCGKGYRQKSERKIVQIQNEVSYIESDAGIYYQANQTSGQQE